MQDTATTLVDFTAERYDAPTGIGSQEAQLRE